MKLLKVIVRPEKVDDVVDALEEAGYPAFTKLNVVGRGKQGGKTKYPKLYNTSFQSAR